MEHFVDSIVGSNDANVAHDPGLEVEVLPRAAEVVRVVDHSTPVLLVHGHLDVVGVRPGAEILVSKRNICFVWNQNCHRWPPTYKDFANESLVDD